MRQGRVCIAGYDSNGRCVRPVLPPTGIPESSLYSRGRLIVFPFAVVAFNLQKQISQPPHTEDWCHDPTSVSFIKRLNDEQKREILEKSLFRDVATLFQVPILAGPGHYVMAGQGLRSLGTVRPKQRLEAIYEQRENEWKPRVVFVDAGNATYRLTVTDLCWRYYCDYQCKAGHSGEEISAVLTKKLRASQVYLRIGLARGWDKYPDRCYVQVTGIYTFPDILEGKTMADFAPDSIQ